jgi:hypothetical protein
MTRIVSIEAVDDTSLVYTLDSGESRWFDITPYLDFEAFRVLKDPLEFRRLENGGYFVEWRSGADLSLDTLNAHSRPKPSGTRTF